MFSERSENVGLGFAGLHYVWKYAIIAMYFTTHCGEWPWQTFPPQQMKGGEIMLLSNAYPLCMALNDCFIPLYSGIAKAIVLVTMLVLLRIMDNAFCRLIDHVSRA